MKSFDQQLIELSKLIGKNKTAFCIGTFDGVHLGHKMLFQKLVNNCRNKKLSSLVIVFEKRPREIVNKGYSRPYLSDFCKRKNKILENGINFLFPMEFNNELRFLNAEVFLKKLISHANIKNIVFSENTRIGNDQLFGEKLEDLCTNLGIEISNIEMTNNFEKVVSSSMISKFIEEGDFINTNKFLGYNYSFEGIVIKGDQIGRTIGFPTANIEVNKKIQIPGDGIYACFVYIKGEKYRGALSVGNRPVIKDDNSRKIEVFIFDFDKNIYDMQIEISVIKKIRNQEFYDSVDIMKTQIKKDIININEVLER